MVWHCTNVAHAHLLHPVRACNLINQLAKKQTDGRTTIILAYDLCKVKLHFYQQSLTNANPQEYILLRICMVQHL